MTAIQNLKAAVGYSWRVPLCALAYVTGAIVSGAMLSALGLPLPQVPEQADTKTMGLLLVVASLALAAGLAPLARTAPGIIPAALADACGAVLHLPRRNIVAGRGHLHDHRGMASVPAFSILPCLLFAAVMALLFRPAARGDSLAASVRRFFDGRSMGQWTWRLAAAIGAFPVIYWTFGMMVAPFVMEYYKQGQFALAAPRPAVILGTQFARSALFLLAAMPVLVTWSGSRRQLILALGLAFYVLVGLFGMIQSYWLAPTLQVLHNTEIFIDSMVYAWALAALLGRPDETKDDELFARYLLCMAQTPVTD